ncbi:MAG: hypothetical protein ACLGGX_07140 [Bdellovibrionia bacterium]
MKNLLFVISVITGALADTSLAQVDRIQSMRFDKSQVQRIYLAPGLGSIVLFPCALQEVFIGRSEDLKAQISPNHKKTMFLNLKLNSSLPTNVIVRCSPERNIFVFDVIPSRSRHQDLVEIRSSYGRPNMVGGQNLQQVTQTKTINRLIVKTPELIENGGRK